jgi:hypothetical protein
MVACIKRLGMSHSSRVFKRALVTVCNQNPERASAELLLLERGLRYSEAKIAVHRLPSILTVRGHSRTQGGVPEDRVTGRPFSPTAWRGVCSMQTVLRLLVQGRNASRSSIVSGSSINI